MAAGNLLVKGFKELLGKVSGNEVTYSSVDIHTIYWKVALWCIAMIIGVVIALVVYMNGKDLSLLLKGDTVRERPVVTKSWGLLALGGLAVIMIAMFLSFVIDSEVDESGYLAIGILIFSAAGIYCMLLFGLGYGFDRLKKRHQGSYYKKMLGFHNFYSRLTDNINIVAIQILIGMTAVYFVWTVSGGIWQADPEKYPFDLVCWETPEKEKEVTEICRKYGDDVASYPSLENFHVNVPLMGLSESTCEELWGETFGLKGKEIAYLWGGIEREIDIFQEDHVKTGIALGWENRVNNDFHSYFLKERVKRKGVLGEYLVDAIVFSDEEFQRLYDKNEGSRAVTIMNGPQETIEKAETELKQLGEGESIEVHEKESLLEAHRVEGTVRFTVVVFGAVTILLFMLFTLCIKLYSDLPSMKRKYRFLHTMGIKGKEKAAMIKQEVTLLVMPPTLIAAAMGTLHCIGFLRTYDDWRNLPFRLIDTYHNPSILWILPQAVVYILIMFLFTVIIRNLMVRWIEKE